MEWTIQAYLYNFPCNNVSTLVTDSVAFDDQTVQGPNPITCMYFVLNVHKIQKHTSKKTNHKKMDRIMTLVIAGKVIDVEGASIGYSPWTFPLPDISP